MQTQRTIAAVLVFFSAILLVALLFGMAGQSAEITIFTFPGSFLIGAFSYGAFYIPIYLIAGAYFLVRKRFNRADIVSLTASILPFLTASLALKTAFESTISTVARPFVLVFGRVGASILLLALSVLLSLLIYSVRNQLRRKASEDSDGNDPATGDKGTESDIRADSKKKIKNRISKRRSKPERAGGDAYRPILAESRFFGTGDVSGAGNRTLQDEVSTTEAADHVDRVAVGTPDEQPDSDAIDEIEDTADTNAEIAASVLVEGEHASTEKTAEQPMIPSSFVTADEIEIEDLGDSVTIEDATFEYVLDDENETSVDDIEDVAVGDDPPIPELIDNGHSEDDSIDDVVSDELALEIPLDVDIGSHEIEDAENLTVTSDEAEEEIGEISGVSSDSPSVVDPAGVLEKDASPVADIDVDMDSDLESAPIELVNIDENDSSKTVVPAGHRSGHDITSSFPTNAPYDIPLDGLLEEYSGGQYWKIDADTQQAADVLKNTLEEFKIKADVTGIRKGPVITMFEILPAPGVKLSKIVNLADNIALRLAASRVRIVAPIPGKHAVGIEVPNRNRAIVSFREMILADAFSDEGMAIPIALGKDIPGEAQIIDLTKTPHLLIAGATGSGKSVCVNSIISSILYRRRPSEVRLLLIDPKIVELKLYNDIPHLLTPVITEPKRAFQALQYCLSEMERRYSLLDALGVRDIASYNKKIKKKRLATLPIPYIVIVVDEFADLMANLGKDLETTLARLAAMSRAVGIHLVLATQRPSVDVITGLIKANIPSRIAFMVASKFDSRIIIDSVGAEKLLGRGDMLLTTAWNPIPIRIQGAFLSEDEVELVAEHIKTLGKPDYIDDEIFIDDDDDVGGYYSDGEADPLASEALEIVVRAGKASASYLQRKLKIGYNRAARLVEDMEERGIVGPPQGSKPREVLRVPD